MAIARTNYKRVVWCHGPRAKRSYQHCHQTTPPFHLSSETKLSPISDAQLYWYCIW